MSIPTSKKTITGRVPPEILQEIFIQCLPIDSASQDTQQLLSSVCRLWRTLVLTTPALWASLDITCNFAILRPPLPTIRTHLLRSGVHPLSFILHGADPEYFLHANPNLLPVLAELATARQRWHHVRIELVGTTQDILDLITLGDAPLLQSIQYDVMEIQHFSIPLHTLHHCPRLESFQWCSPGASLLLPLVDTPLTSLSLQTYLSVSECVTLLRLSPRLSSAQFHGIYSSNPFPDPYSIDFSTLLRRLSGADPHSPHPPNPPPVPHLIHPTLSTLTVVGEQSITLLAALTLPALLNLDLTTGDTKAPLPTKWDAALSAFLARSHPALRHLSLSMTHMQSLEPVLQSILTLTPHLRSLRLSGYPPYSSPFTAAVIRTLHPLPPPSVPLCARLQRLELSWIEDCPDGLCIAMLRARWGARARANGVASLEWAHIEFEGGIHDRDQMGMRKLCAEGMQGEICPRDPE